MIIQQVAQTYHCFILPPRFILHLLTIFPMLLLLQTNSYGPTADSSAYSGGSSPIRQTPSAPPWAAASCPPGWHSMWPAFLADYKCPRCRSILRHRPHCRSPDSGGSPTWWSWSSAPPSSSADTSPGAPVDGCVVDVGISSDCGGSSRGLYATYRQVLRVVVRVERTLLEIPVLVLATRNMRRHPGL